ncbi:MAG TPA: MBL fold metallo-hydrolase [Stellaceae bacterium]|nr:MBL fold metallo-hydrolase [Stellaceae bacterium]
MEVTFIGSGDAFGSGGRFNTCFLLAGARCRILVDCGASSMVALKRAGIAPNGIDGVVLSHLHGDHFGGLPFLLLDAHHLSRRERPFFVLGPQGFGDRLEAAQEALFPGSSKTALRFPLVLEEITAGVRAARDGFAVTPFPANHSAGAPCHSLRIEMDGKVVTYSGDTGWTDALYEAARGADLFICECSSFERMLAGHLSYAELAPRLASLGARRVILTHMNPDMLEQVGSLPHETAADGMTLVV